MTGADAIEPRQPALVTDDVNGTSSEITRVLTRRPRAGLERELEQWMVGVTEAAARFPGHLGARLFRPTPPDRPEYVLVYTFSDPQSLAAWDRSEERATWLWAAEPLTEGLPHLHAFSAIDGWFSTPGRAPAAPPPR